MKREDILKHCKYYKGEENNPYKSNSERGFFWFGEKSFADISDAAVWQDWIAYGKNLRPSLTGEAKESVQNLDDVQFAMACFLETMYSRQDPYSSVKWIFNY